MKRVKIKGLEIKPSSGDAFPYETAPDMPKLHTCLIANAKRGGSKTTSIVNLMEHLPFDRIFIVSPTYNSNLNLMSRLKVEPDDIYDDPNDISCLDSIMDKINQERDDLEEYLQKIRRWKELQKFLNNHNELFTIPDDLLEDFFNNGQFQKPVWKYGLENGNELKPKKPCCVIFFDDCMNSAIFSSKGIKKLNQMVIYMRHLGQLKDGGAIGCSFIFAVQSYKAQNGGISKVIRNQMTHMMLFKTKNENELDEIAEEVAGEVNKKTFMKLYHEAIKEKFDFLFIDLHKKDNHPSMFRRNFNEFLMYNEEEEKV
jgi:hypothetical protein